ncbi:conserved membrane hypothetical protein [Sulfurovum sp. enrichment culture clone C5]|uniref:Glycosyltransferase RgtA/B/C/D-like domain-containing protein n=1 Tax=Sulfurovum sp. enrichment culture clone C5 TaxID=497650 RepID=A0A0S4XNZ4_9BACT|nr:conserved membrane hypothetical protein [Sulfurovum sp. enrichment culture clone C5]
MIKSILVNRVTIYLLYAVVISYFAYFIPITPNEAFEFYKSDGLVSKFMHFGYSFFQNTFGIRLLFVINATVALFLFDIFSRDILKDKNDALQASAIFALLPAMIFGGAIANIALIVFNLVLIYLISYYRKFYFGEAIALLLLFLIHDASIFFFLSIFIYGVFKKEKRTAIFGVLALIGFWYFHRGIEISGHPWGHFVETFSIYAAVFSPFIFLYFLYVIYRIWIKEEKDIVWSISSFAFFVSILLSIRQRILVTDFTPYVLVGFVLMFRVYFQSLRVRLPKFQKIYKNGFNISMGSLVVVLIFVFSQPLIFNFNGQYLFTKVYEPYKIQKQLKEKNIHCFNSKNKKAELQLKFYGISRCKK